MPNSPSPDLANLWQTAYRHRVRLAFGAHVLGSIPRSDPLYVEIGAEVLHRSRWQSGVRTFAEAFFAELEKVSCKAVALKGFVVKSYYPDGTSRDIWDLDCAVSDFDEFTKFQSVLSQFGGRIEHLAIRRNGDHLAGAAEMRISEVGDLYKSIKVECFIGGQPQSRFHMRPFEASFWEQAECISEKSKIRGPSLPHCLTILAGEVVENKDHVRLRDFMDFRAMCQMHQNAPLELGTELSEMVDALNCKMIRFANTYGLPIPQLAPETFRQPERRGTKPDRRRNMIHRSFPTVRALSRMSRSDRVINLVSKVFPLRALWNQGCYVDAVPFLLGPKPNAKTTLELEKRILTTEFGQFILAPFGVLTDADIQAVQAKTTSKT
ncbi:MAG: hypothetical protein COB16_13110 [Rhodobacteraceae bacterium]|nr:MAG: hypothetical protein COB16_13110 [Paracoccaceae bacterium]